MSTIPVSQIVQVNPGVLAAAGSAVNLNGLILTQSTYPAIGSVMSFATAAAVGAFFGLSSTEYSMASTYFASYTNSTKTPGMLYMAQYNEAQVAGYNRGGTLGLTLAQLQALSGTLTIVVDGTSVTSSTINLSSATSFTNAATIIQAGFTGLGATVSYDALHSCFTVTSSTVGAGCSFTGTIATTTLTVTAVASGTLQVGQVISGTGVTTGTKITALVSGTGGTGTYTITPSQTVSTSTAMTTSVSSVGYATGTLSGSLNLTAVAGATLSAGAAAATPGAFMSALVLITQNWACFTTTWESVLSEKEAFAAWTATNSPRYAYVCTDSDINALTAGSTVTFGSYLQTNSVSGVVPVWTGTDDFTHAAFVLGYAASLDFNRLNGRTTLAFRNQSGLIPAVTNANNASALQTNGYLFYGAWANATQTWNFMYAGAVSGQWTWFDTYLNQIWLNANLQLAMVTLLTSVGSVPYNQAGYGLIYAACQAPIQAAVNFGAIRTGVALSPAQVAQMQYALGKDVSSTITAQGWYLQITPATAATRIARASPSMTLFYADGQSVQSLTLASIEVQ